jgi:CTP:molybdopterin cytidylyltransferase MocA
MTKAPIHPILLAAGPSARIAAGNSAMLYRGKNALEIAVENCNDLETPIVVLGHRATFLLKFVPPSARVVINRKWRSGQLASLLAGLELVPQNEPFLLYPVDHVFLMRDAVHEVVRAYQSRTTGHEIVMPQFKGRSGHPVVFSPALRTELQNAATARDVVYRDSSRLALIEVDTPAVLKDYRPQTIENVSSGTRKPLLRRAAARKSPRRASKSDN